MDLCPDCAQALAAAPGEPQDGAVCRDRMLYPILLVMDHPRILTLTSSLWLVPAACFIPTEANERTLRTKQFSNQFCSLAADVPHALRAGAFSFCLMRPSGNMMAIHSPALQHLAAGEQGVALFDQ